MGNTHSNFGHTAMPTTNNNNNNQTIAPVSPTLLPPSVTVMQNPLGATIYLVGVNHVSQTSCEDVRQTIHQVQPDTIFLELSRERFSSITYNGPLKIQPIVLFNGITAFAQSLMARVTFYQAALLDVRPGAEFRVALEEARKSNTNVILGDRVGDITWQRMMNKLSLVDVVQALPKCIDYAREFSRLPTKDAMKQYLLDTMPSDKHAHDPSRFWFPSLYPVMVSEKDLYIASVLRECPGKRIVAVVGKGHVAGITQHLNDQDDPYLLRAELTRTSRVSGSPLVQQTALAIGGVTAMTAVVSALMSKRLHKANPHKWVRTTIPITLLLLTMQAGVATLWLTNEWMKLHTSVTQAVLTWRDEEDTKRAIRVAEAMENNENNKST